MTLDLWSGRVTGCSHSAIGFCSESLSSCRLTTAAVCVCVCVYLAHEVHWVSSVGEEASHFSHGAEVLEVGLPLNHAPTVESDAHTPSRKVCPTQSQHSH